MLTSKVKKMKPIDRFFYWIKERNKIYLKRKKGIIKPWTDDEVLQNNFFTNPYRENDKTTQWFRKYIRDPLKDSPKVVFATICFRWFNLPHPTGEMLVCEGLTVKWNEANAKQLLKSLKDRGDRLFTGAYMIASSQGVPKYVNICDRLTEVWNNRHWMMGELGADCSLENFQDTFVQFDGLGSFMAYEIVCDLRHTDILKDAYDVNTWCNVGPGATRGLYRIHEVPFDTDSNSYQLPPLENELDFITDLLDQANSSKSLWDLPIFELREIEHSLCEWDKYERVLWDQGRSKRKYKGV